MIVRNSLKSVYRTPLKSILFFLLIMSLSTALTLGTALVGMCNALIDECDRSYLTIASLEYRGGRFPDKSVTDPNAAELRSQIDFEGLSKVKGVKAVDRSDTVIASIPGLNRSMSTDSACRNAVVLVVRKLISGNDLGKVEKALYANAIYDASTVNIIYSGPERGSVETPTGSVPAGLPEGTVEKIEEGRTYLLTGFTDGNIAGVITVYVSSVLNQKAVDGGIQQTSCIIDVTDDKKLENGDPRYQQFFDAAEAYELINHSWNARISSDPAVLEPFVEREYALRDGYIYGAHGTEADFQPAEDTIECLLPDIISDRLNLKPGDEFVLDLTQLYFSSIANSYWPGADKGFANGSYAELKCTLSGVITTTANEIPLIYLSGLTTASGGSETDELSGTYDGFCGYTLGTLLLENGRSEKILSEVRKMLPEGVDVAVYDQGYGVVTKAIARLRDDAAGVMAAAIIASAAMLILFAYVFVGRQSDTLVTMYLMGTGRSQIALYVSVAAALVLIPSSIAGSILAGAFSGNLSNMISRTVAQSQTELMRYSSASLGVIKEFDPTVSMPSWPQLVCSVCLILAGLGVCLLFLRSALASVGARPKEIKKVAKKAAEDAKNAQKTAKKPHSAKPLPFSGAGRKYIVLSLLRGGIRSIAVLLAGILMTVFVLVPAAALTSYRRQLKELNEDTVITCYFTDYGGKKRYDLVLLENMIGSIMESEYFSDFHFSLCDNYAITSLIKPLTGDDTGNASAEVTHLDVTVPSPGFSYENFLSNFLNGPKIFYTDKITSAPEFAGRADAEIRWLEGYDDTYFSEERDIFDGIYPRGSNYYSFLRDLREYCIVVPDSFLEEYGVELGDSVEMLVSEDLVTETYKIIGVFRSVSSVSFIYTRQDNCHKIILWPKAGGSAKDSGIVKGRTSFSSGTFLLNKTSDIAEAKKWLRDNGYSRVHAAGFYRLYPIMEDQEYLSSLEKLERNIGYLEKMLPAISALVLLTGFAAAYLLTFRRRVEIATLRSVGETAGRVFAIFAVEQILPALIGACAGMAVWVLIFGAAGPVWLSAAFIAGFALGTAVSVFRMSRANLLDVLSEKE